MKTKALQSLLLAGLLSFAPCASAAQSSHTDAPRSAAGRAPHASLAIFSALPADITYPQLIRRAGSPDDDIGSGIYVFRYHLADGSIVFVGTPDRKRLLYVTHVAGTVRTQLWPSVQRQ